MQILYPLNQSLTYIIDSQQCKYYNTVQVKMDEILKEAEAYYGQKGML